jgi:hypothetical protein
VGFVERTSEVSMVIQIPLSLSGDPAAFHSALASHCASLEAHRIGPPGVPSPVAHPMLDSLIERVPQSGPVAARGPDTFQVLPYEIVDDTPPPPTLQQKQAALLMELIQAGQVTRNAILSPARANLLNISAGEAMSITDTARTPDQVAAIAAYVAFEARSTEIATNAARAAVEIEDLTESTVDTWKVPSL